MYLCTYSIWADDDRKSSREFEPVLMHLKRKKCSLSIWWASGNKYMIAQGNRTYTYVHAAAAEVVSFMDGSHVPKYNDNVNGTY